MITWQQGMRILSAVTKRDDIGLVDFIAMMAKSSVARASGTALFLTGHPDATPMALLHNIKHNKVLHESNVILNVVTQDMPRVPKLDRQDCTEATFR